MHYFLLEWKKMKHFRSFWLLSSLYIVLLPTLMLIPKSFKHIPEQIGGKNTFYMFPSVWEHVGYLGNWLSFFILGFLAVIFITVEFNNRTFRQNIITGLSRINFIKSKVIFIFIISLAATLYYIFVCITYGALHTEHIFVSKVIEHVDYSWRYFIMCFSYMTIGLFIGLIIRKTGGALFLYLSYGIFIELFIRYVVHLKLFSGRTMHFYPINAAEDLVPVPFAEMAQNFMDQNGFSMFLTPNEAILVSGVWILIFLALSVKKITSTDI